jgi:hypothetical protein
LKFVFTNLPFGTKPGADQFIDKDRFMQSAKAYGKSPHDEHFKAVAEGKVRY